MNTFTVVENAGYENETDVKGGFDCSRAAWDWARNHYDQDEMDELHVEVRCDNEDGETYEF